MNQLRMLCWKGYKSVLAEHARELADLGVEVKVTEDLDADRILRKFSGATDFYDIVVVDWEYRHRYERLVLPISDKHVRLSSYLEPFKDRYWYEVGSRLAFVPLRFGTNGFVYRLAAESVKTERFSVSLNALLESANEGKIKQVALWDWWLPNMLLLARAEGFDPPHELTDDQLRHLSDGALKKYLRATKRSSPGGPPPIIFRSLLDIISYEVATPRGQRHIDWILGPSEMVVAPISRAQRLQNQPDTLDWDIPREGGLVWLETAALSRDLAEDREKLEAAYRLIDYLQSPPIQLSLLCGSGAKDFRRVPEGYWSYVLNNSEGLDLVPQDYRSVFHNKFFEESALQFGRWVTGCLNKGSLVMRALPSNVQVWRNIWQEALKAYV